MILQSGLAQSRLIRVATSRRTQNRIQTHATNILLNVQYKQGEPPDIPGYDIWNARDDSDVPDAIRDAAKRLRKYVHESTPDGDGLSQHPFKIRRRTSYEPARSKKHTKLNNLKHSTDVVDEWCVFCDTCNDEYLVGAKPLKITC